MNVDFRAQPVRDAKHAIQLPVGIAIQRGGIDAAHHFSAFAYGGFQPCWRARTGHHACLRKRHQFDIDGAAPFLSRRHDGVQVCKAGRGIHVHVASHRHRAERRSLRDQRIGAPFYGRRGSELFLLDSQPLAQARCGPMRPPAVADEALVQMDMAIDKARQHKVPTQVGHAGPVYSRRLGAQCKDAAIAHVQEQGIAVRADGIDV